MEMILCHDTAQVLKQRVLSVVEVEAAVQPLSALL